MEKLLIITFIVLAVFFWIWSIFDITRSRFENPKKKLRWLLIILFLNFIGSIVYFQFKHKLVTKEKRTFQPNFNRA